MNEHDFRFINLTPIWSAVELIGGARDRQKRRFASSRLWRGQDSTHIVGVAGEMIAAFQLGASFDAVPRLHGDKGYDFADGTDVKTATYWPPILKHPVDAKHWPRFFALVYFDERGLRGCTIGKVDADTLRRSRTRRFRPDAPENYIMEADEVFAHRVQDLPTP